jgi:hypothetical protein
MDPKHHKLVSFTIGLMYLALLQTFSTPQPVFRYLILSLVAYSAVVWYYNNWFLNKIEKKNFWLALRPVLLFWSGLGIFVLLPSPFLRALFLLLTVGIIFIFEMLLANYSENVMLSFSALTMFGFFIGIVGVGQYFPPLNSGIIYFIYISLIFSAVYLISRSFYEFAPQPKKNKNAAAVILGLFSGQIFWALSFLPFHFSVLGTLLFNAMFFCLALNYYYYFQIITFKKIQFHLLLLILTCGAVLLSTPWRIIK